MLRGLTQINPSVPAGRAANVGPARLVVRVHSNNKENAGNRLARELLDVVQGDTATASSKGTWCKLLHPQLLHISCCAAPSVPATCSPRCLHCLPKCLRNACVMRVSHFSVF
jgi:hypothetical protein